MERHGKREPAGKEIEKKKADAEKGRIETAVRQHSEALEKLINPKLLQSAINKIQKVEFAWQRQQGKRKMADMPFFIIDIATETNVVGAFLGKLERANTLFERYMKENRGTKTLAEINKLLNSEHNEPMTIDEFKTYFFRLAVNKYKLEHHPDFI